MTLEQFHQLAVNDQWFAVHDKLKQVLATDVPAFNKLVQEKQVPAVMVKSAK